MLLEAVESFESQRAQLARVGVVDLGLNAVAILPPTFLLVPLGVSLRLELLLAAWALLVVGGILLGLVLLLLHQHLSNVLVVLGDIRFF